MQPSSIKVAYRRTMQPKQYETAEASAEAEFVFAEGEETNVDNILSAELSRLKNNVHAVLGLDPGTKEAPKTAPSPTKPAAAPKDTKPATPPAGTPASGAKPPSPSGPTATKPASPSKPAAPKPAAPKAPAAPPAAKADDAPKVTKGDMMKAISNTMTSLQKKGITDGNDRINQLVRAYLPEDAEPPISYARIPEDSWGDFISDVEKLKNVTE